MSISTNAVSATSAAATTTASATDPTAGLANEQTFLKLLVAQLENQDPLSPADGIQFVTQLAQFSSLEQTMQMRQSLENLETIDQSILNLQEAGATNGTQSAG